MAMDSYIKGVADRQRAVPVKPTEGSRRTQPLEDKDSVQDSSVQESQKAAKKAAETESVSKKSAGLKSSRKVSALKSSKKTVLPKTSAKKVSSVPGSNAKKASAVAKDTVKKTPVQSNSTSKVNRAQVQKADDLPKIPETVEENMEALFAMEKEPSVSTIDAAISMMNARMAKTTCAYSYDEDTGRVTIRMYDDETNELIREVPPEKSLEALKKIWEMAGIMVDEKF